MSLLAFDKQPLNKVILVVVSLMLIPTIVFAQTFGWVAGYVNYVVSAVVMLYFFYIFKKMITERLTISTPILIGYMILAVISMLIVEHVSLYLLLMGFVSILLYFSRYRRIPIHILLIFISFVVGAVMMFSNKAYYNVAVGKDTYRTVGSDDDVFKTMLNIYYVDNIYLISLMFIVCLYTVVKLKRLNLLNIILLLCLSLGPVYLFFNRAHLVIYSNNSVYTIAYSVFLLFIISFSIFVIYNFYKTDVFETLLLYLMSSIGLTLPFFVITPYGGRTTLASFVFLILIILKMLDFSLRHTEIPFIKTLSTGIFLILLLSVVFPIFENKKTELERDDMVAHLGKGNTSIVLKPLPYPKFHHMVNPTESTYMTQFYKEYYGVSKKIKFKFEKIQ